MGWVEQLFARRRCYNELSQSIQEHLEEKIADLMDRGMTREEAERTTRREFGNVTLIEQRGREVWQWSRLESILADLRFGLRQFRKAPGFAVTAILVVALGIAASVTIFTFVNAALLKPLPYQAPSRLVAVFGTPAPALNAASPIRTIRIGRAATLSSNRSRSGNPTLIFGAVLPGLNLCA